LRPWIAEKYGKQADNSKTTVRMANGHTQKTNGVYRIKAKTATLEMNFEAVILKKLIADVLISYDFLTKQQVTNLTKTSKRNRTCARTT